MRATKVITLCFCFTLLLMNTQCDDDDLIDAPCDQTVVVDNGFFESAESDDYNLINAEINDNCLTIEISASGCDGSTWSMVLVDSGFVTETFPVERILKFVFTNNEDCLAVFEQQRSFDLSPLRTNDGNEVILTIEGFPEQLSYTYP